MEDHLHLAMVIFIQVIQDIYKKITDTLFQVIVDQEYPHF